VIIICRKCGAVLSYSVGDGKSKVQFVGGCRRCEIGGNWRKTEENGGKRRKTEENGVKSEENGVKSEENGVKLV